MSQIYISSHVLLILNTYVVIFLLQTVLGTIKPTSAWAWLGDIWDVLSWSVYHDCDLWEINFKEVWARLVYLNVLKTGPVQTSTLASMHYTILGAWPSPRVLSMGWQSWHRGSVKTLWWNRVTNSSALGAKAHLHVRFRQNNVLNSWILHIR